MTIKSYIKSRRFHTKNLHSFMEVRKMKWNEIPVFLTIEYIKSENIISVTNINIDNRFSIFISPIEHSIALVKKDKEIYNYVLPSKLNKYEFVDGIMNRGIKKKGNEYTVSIDDKTFKL